MMLHRRSLFEANPRLILAHADAAYAAAAEGRLSRAGWEVYRADSAGGARRLARALTPGVIVLDTDLPDETGWLMCRKLTWEMPEVRVFLLGRQATPEAARRARMVGAAGLYAERDAVRALGRGHAGAALPVF